ncbi:hypothetical protein GGTG_05227 [Gaeumannomyces tritici R3-111a-1]|uniref:Signal recognition particle subunit SRP14 n=1 Tax=Gaeumannomyces tritici (strain R3-111a-1) TaxID=644352 RepID=J3NVB4_GAET3|nr:hypothetical protein GGTG_05227 [Gaeumannomyces tritici R3-111a-1]EJT75290.1 hypothetical protein GGTG_05227 [Gaeumannomyces tritici R3-111a-1]
MGHLTSDEFFVKLAELFESRKGQDHGAVYLTQKRLTYGQQQETDGAAPLADLSPAGPLPVLIRATDGKTGDKGSKRAQRLKLSTIVEPDALDAFYARYAEVCKAGMAALKPRDKSKKKAKAKKRKGAAATGKAA